MLLARATNRPRPPVGGPKQQPAVGRLAATDFDADHPLLRDGFVYNMVLQHEYQHNETMLQTFQLKLGRPYTPLARLAAPVPGPVRFRAAQFGASAARARAARS